MPKISSDKVWEMFDSLPEVKFVGYRFSREDIIILLEKIQKAYNDGEDINRMLETTIKGLNDSPTASPPEDSQ